MARVLIGVSSSIAIYKICDLVRELKKLGHDVKVIMTPFSENFVSRLTFKTLTNNKVYIDWSEDSLAHINLARWADVFLIAPCSVNTLSKIATGIGDNLLTTTVLAYERPLLIAPAANVVMYKNPIVQEHLKRLKELGHIIIEPEEGLLACQEEGQGKLASNQRLIDWIEYSIRPKPLQGKRILITCGATREHIDRVRFISNESSGKMGFSLARVLRWYGASVKVVAGFTTAQEPPEVEIHRVSSSDEMYKKVLELFPWSHVVIMNAAVSDFKVLESFQGKIKKGEKLTLELVKTVDILEELGRIKGDRLLVGFALEEEEKLLEYGWEKLKKKNLDVLVANPLKVMGSEDFVGYVLFKDGSYVSIKSTNKLHAAEELVKIILNIKE
ncbi:bifunctional phosphopantothenoylcysteine decarboxylase/phosphopantothenate--cysteine ligase CoaBC [Thermocrinis minervae]|uniref:Coenzyme A biosynthesis bifunctional protein CoaBC n=1 Tax=Thermocrinis minervae TaxID=381751 RepID=A0A1M6TLB5_9AQUI|nr:bifunctional phosphopantothenoylcysteine decarboxylase/phosphopantothenate--cysteine ligase CoaBC [Thermocrinis minervae]SHK57679.1 Phosphopantothenate-cysteine ligase /Phosphopantothenoylcysteine decarboxylase [Thermocrinis minervae]